MATSDRICEAGECSFEKTICKDYGEEIYEVSHRRQTGNIGSQGRVHGFLFEEKLIQNMVLIFIYGRPVILLIIVTTIVA